MEITNVKLTKVIENKNVKAWGNITIDGIFVVHGVKIVEANDKLFVAMPSRKTAEGKYIDICHPISEESRELIKEAVFAEYEKIKNTPAE